MAEKKVKKVAEIVKEDKLARFPTTAYPLRVEARCEPEVTGGVIRFQYWMRVGDEEFPVSYLSSTVIGTNTDGIRTMHALLETRNQIEGTRLYLAEGLDPNKFPMHEGKRRNMTVALPKKDPPVYSIVEVIGPGRIVNGEELQPGMMIGERRVEKIAFK